MNYIEREDYSKPRLTKLDNIKALTKDCPEFECSISVPPPPPPAP